MIQKTACIAALLALSPMAQAQTVYRCADENGRAVFSQTPCAPDAQAVQVRPSAPSEDQVRQAQAHQAYVGGEIDGALRANRQQIAQDRLREAEGRRDAELSAINDARRYAANNAAGASYLQSLAQKEQAAVAMHNAEIEAARKELEAARKDGP